MQLSGTGPTVYDAAGGRDLRVAFNPSTTSNTFYLSGGKQSTSSGPASMSDIYTLEISGTLSPNLPNSTTGSWSKQEIGKLKSLSGIGSTVIGQKIVTYGGCESSAAPDASCATQDAYVLDTSSGNSISPGGCAAPRLNPAVVANMNTASSNFDTQALIMLGTFNTTSWEDGNGLEKSGEVVRDFVEYSAVFDLNKSRISSTSVVVLGLESCHLEIRAAVPTIQRLVKGRLRYHLRVGWSAALAPRIRMSLSLEVRTRRETILMMSGSSARTADLSLPRVNIGLVLAQATSSLAPLLTDKV